MLNYNSCKQRGVDNSIQIQIYTHDFTMSQFFNFTCAKLSCTHF